MHQIHITSNLNNNILKQLCNELFKDFVKETIINNQKNESKNENKFLNKLSYKYKNYRQYKDMVNMANNISNGGVKDSKIYCVLDGDKVIGFEMAQVTKEKNKIIGWKPWMYIKPSYRMKKVITEQTNGEEKILSRVLDNEVEKWFNVEKITHQRTSTGKRMIKNMLCYVREGFLPMEQNKNTVFMEKSMDKPYEKSILKEAAKNIKMKNIEIFKDIENFRLDLKNNVKGINQNLNDVLNNNTDKIKEKHNDLEIF